MFGWCVRLYNIPATKVSPAPMVSTTFAFDEPDGYQVSVQWAHSCLEGGDWTLTAAAPWAPHVQMRITLEDISLLDERVCAKGIDTDFGLA